MGSTLESMPLLTCIYSGKGDLPIVRVSDLYRQTTSCSWQTSFFPCTPLCRRFIDRTAAAPTVGETSSVQMI